MKLVASNLVGVYEQTEEIRRLSAVTAYSEVRADLANLSQQISGCIHLIDELNLAYESMKSSGYSTEWMDIINKDNNFLAVVNVDMPKFFGGDEAKQTACEGAIIDTIKKWASVVWEWIKKAYNKLLEVLKWVMGLWVHNSRPKGEVVETFDKVVGMMKDSDNPKVRDAFRFCFEDMVMRSPTVLMNYLDSYDALSDVLETMVNEVTSSKVEDLYKQIDDMSNRGKIDVDMRNQFLASLASTADMQIDINTAIMDYITRLWTVPTNKIRNKQPSMEHNGFSFGSSSGSGIIEFVRVFTDEDKIPRVKIGYSNFDVPDQKLYLKQMDDVIERGRKVIIKLESQSKKKIRDLVDKHSKRARDQVADPNISFDSPRHRLAQSILKLCQTCLYIDSELTSKTSTILHRCSADMNTFLDRMNTIAHNLDRDAGKDPITK